jgi:hypothetical protein
MKLELFAFIIIIKLVELLLEEALIIKEYFEE